MKTINRSKYKGLGRPRKSDYSTILGLVGLLISTGVLVFVAEYLIQVLS